MPPLELPRPGRLPAIDRLSQYEAVRLFMSVPRLPGQTSR